MITLKIYSTSLQLQQKRFLQIFFKFKYRFDQLIKFFIVYFLFFQIAKAKAESRIECLKNGDGNGTYIIFY